MTSYLRINHFVEATNQASAAHQNYLVANDQGLGVTLKNLPEAFSAAGLELNKRTWRVFRESLLGTIGQDKFNWICTRYRSKINFTKLEQTGAALLPEHVELFSIGSSQLRIRDIKLKLLGEIRSLTAGQLPERVARSLTPQELANRPIRTLTPEELADREMKSLTRTQLAERMRQAQPFPVLGEYVNPTEIYATPRTFSAWFVHDKVSMDKEKQLLFSDVEGISFQAWVERMTKATSCRELLASNLESLEGQLIPAPGRDGRLDYYEVYNKVSTGHGLVAYALKPAAADSTLKPMIIFRPSQFALSNEDAIETYLNDVQARVGEMGWLASIRSFELLMNDRNFRRNEEKVEIAGYSLGGAHAQYFLEAHHENVSHATFYSDPSVTEVIAERFATNINQMPRRTEPLNIQIFRMKKDFCQYVGGKHVGWGVTHPDVRIQLSETAHENNSITASYLHAHRIFDNRAFPYAMQNYENPQELSDHLDNSKRGPEVFWYERMRRIWGQVAFYTFRGFAQMTHLVSWILGVKILRSSRDSEIS